MKKHLLMERFFNSKNSNCKNRTFQGVSKINNRISMCFFIFHDNSPIYTLLLLLFLKISFFETNL